VSTFIAIFFNVALAACAARSMRGQDTKVGEGISAALRLIGPILGCAHRPWAGSSLRSQAPHGQSQRFP
jgi:hypothetical protein